MKRRFIFQATAVLLLAACMRLIALHDVPPGLAQDEVLNADVASFIRGGYHALFFREGYGHEPLYHYWQVPFQVLLGDNVLSIRLPAVVVGLLLVALAMRWTKREFGARVALLTGILLAVSWWPIIFSRIGLRPGLEPLMLLLFAWFWPRRPWLAGLFLGLSLYTYTGARVVFAIPLLLALYGWLAPRVGGARRPELPPRFVRRALIVLSTVVAIFMPLWLTLRADPTLQQRVDQLAGPLDALAQGELAPLLQTTWATLGVFSATGDPRWTYALPDRALFDPLTAVFFYGGLLLSLWRWRRPAYALALIWLVVGLIPSAVTPDAPSTVRMIGALPVVYLMPALGFDWAWRQVSARAPRRWISTMAGVLVAVLLGWNLARTVRDGFIVWPQALETRLKYQTVLLDMARYWDAHPHQPLVIADGFYRPITVDSLRRDLGRPLPARWVQTGATVAGALVLPAEGGGLLYVPEFAAPDGGLLQRVMGDSSRSPATGSPPAVDYRSSQSPSFAVYTLPDSLILSQAADARFEGKITLVGYEILPVASGQPLQLLTAWRVEGPLPADLAAFVHLVDAGERLVGQHDGFDAAPVTLQPGDTIVQRHVIPLAGAGLPQGAALQVGLYTRGDGRRLLLDAPVAGEPPDRVRIEDVSHVD